jgi:hypothetical protein
MLSDSEYEAEVCIEVPAFTDAVFSQSRIYDEFDDISTSTGDVQVKEDLSIDLLERLRSSQ